MLAGEIKHTKGFICGCCKKRLKISVLSHTSGNICRYCYHNCESLTGTPRCYKERKRIGGYWRRGRKKIFIKEIKKK
jgi:hypothetical protein